MLANHYDHFANDDSGTAFTDGGKLATAFGVSCEIVGVVSLTTDVELLELLTPTLAVDRINPSLVVFWSEACIGADIVLESCSAPSENGLPAVSTKFVATMSASQAAFAVVDPAQQ